MKEVQIGVAYNFEGKYLATMPSSLNVRRRRRAATAVGFIYSLSFFRLLCVA